MTTFGPALLIHHASPLFLYPLQSCTLPKSPTRPPLFNAPSCTHMLRLWLYVSISSLWCCNYLVCYQAFRPQSLVVAFIVVRIVRFTIQFVIQFTIDAIQIYWWIKVHTKSVVNRMIRNSIRDSIHNSRKKIQTYRGINVYHNCCLRLVWNRFAALPLTFL